MLLSLDWNVLFCLCEGDEEESQGETRWASEWTRYDWRTDALVPDAPSSKIRKETGGLKILIPDNLL